MHKVPMMVQKHDFNMILIRTKLLILPQTPTKTNKSELFQPSCMS